jgi:hypothetical protein
MCVHGTLLTVSASAKVERTSKRTVVLLRESARKKLERFVATEKVSSGEIIRRSLEAYETLESQVRRQEEEKAVAACLAMMTEALEGANRSLENTCRRLDRLDLELNRERPHEPGRELFEGNEANPAGNREYQAAG